jgi:hypothetical protein
MSNYNNNSNSPQQPSSAYTSRKQEDYHPLQNQHSNTQYNASTSGGQDEQQHYELNNHAGGPKKRNVITEARSGIVHGAHAVRGGISNGTLSCFFWLFKKERVVDAVP